MRGRARADHRFGHARTARGCGPDVVGVAVVRGVPPVVTWGGCREAGRRVVGAVPVDCDAGADCVPPVLQLVGASETGPKTMKLMVPVASGPELDAITELMLLAERATPTVPVVGAEAETVGLALVTTVEAMPDPQVERRRCCSCRTARRRTTNRCRPAWARTTRWGGRSRSRTVSPFLRSFPSQDRCRGRGLGAEDGKGDHVLVVGARARTQRARDGGCADGGPGRVAAGHRDGQCRRRLGDDRLRHGPATRRCRRAVVAVATVGRVPPVVAGRVGVNVAEET